MRLEPGIYKATVRGVANVTVIVDDLGWGRSSDCLRVTGYSGHEHMPGHITDAIPLILLNIRLCDPITLARVLRAEGYRDLANQVEAQSRPPRIEEPGLWGVVEASLQDTFDQWVHMPGGKWCASGWGLCRWDELNKDRRRPVSQGRGRVMSGSARDCDCCEQGKHSVCRIEVWADDIDDWGPCPCDQRGHEPEQKDTP